jgi:hypothetical protein
MNEFLRNFVMETIRGMTESTNVAEWQVREYALGWYTKGVLTEADLQEIQDRYKKPEPVEEVVAENETTDTEEEGE